MIVDIFLLSCFVHVTCFSRDELKHSKVVTKGLDVQYTGYIALVVYLKLSIFVKANSFLFLSNNQKQSFSHLANL